MELGFRYLWIDCLCNVQDDFEHWACESGNMVNIYGEASLVLAAVTSRSPESGFYHHSRVEDGPFEVPFRPDRENGVVETVHVRKQLDHGENYPYPWRQEAWTFQEAWLARRVIEFQDDEVSYGCRRATWCCCTDPSDEASEQVIVAQSNSNPAGPELNVATLNNPDESSTATADGDARPNEERSPQPLTPSADIATSGSKPHGAGTLPKGISTDSNGKILSIFADWPSILETYSSRHLTKDGDKLAALSGVARRYSDVTGAHYLAGLWGQDLIQGLCWYSERGYRRRPSQPRGTVVVVGLD
ncbi:hypothetical protein C8A05DRAFT_40038 [Staphylotrichum tortipilum]|uniref:Heterokaryon incompatibility domain-containing protein n=1 Tax=Staphylotrichum tortipilum TaxID=2831512 RepID=A0AAN6M8H2_9PEZI|nr:hypothetical protein C8A05DRAFT_40038 [Staphylotrichum longicolle]